MVFDFKRIDSRLYLKNINGEWGVFMESYILAIGKQSLFLILILSGPPVLVALVVGLMISLIQATTQIQEQTLTFVPKLVAVFLTLAFSGSWLMTQLVAFTRALLDGFPTYIH
jgi:flagellar biosynthetic protein FliQ